MKTTYKVKTRVHALPTHLARKTIVMREIMMKSFEILNDSGEWEPAEEAMILEERHQLNCEED